MKIVLRFVVVLGIFVLSPCPFFLNIEQAFAYHVQQRYPRNSTVDLPFYSLTSRSVQNRATKNTHAPFRYSKIRFTPGKILGRPFNMPQVLKKPSRISHIHNQRKHLLREQIKKTQTGIVVELESAYGIYNTFIGRLQHGTQFRGAHYYMSGHWEKTEGEREDKKEENIAGSLKVDWDISKSSTLSLDSSYFQSHVALPQLQGNKRHKKSAIQATAGFQTHFETDTSVAIALSGEQASFSDHDGVRFMLNSYGAQLHIKQLWSAKNTLSFHSTGYWDEYLREDDRYERRYYGTGTLVNSFVMHNKFAIDAGVRFDYYHSEDPYYTDYFIAPIVTTRLQPFRRTTLYATYQPRLKFPRFTDLYVRKLYTTVNPELHSEKVRHYVESGITQRIGDSVSLNIGFFYQESKNMISQIDRNSDNILEYYQLGSANFTGLKTNLQINYKEQFVQSITYTYTTYDIFSGQDVNEPGEILYDEILPYQANHQVQTSLYWITPFGLEIDFNGTYVSEQYRNRYSEQSRIGKRFFINVDLTQKITDNFQVFLVGRNLTDTDTYDIIPLLDSEEITSSRLFIGGVRFRF